MDFPFTTDGCSGGMTATWRLFFRLDPPWNDLCVDHDRTYWAGGSRAYRAAADRDLRNSVARRGYPVWAWLMWAAVRIGGHPLLPTSWRWGYGWKYPRGYTQ
jgi:hypothetical protein